MTDSHKPAFKLNQQTTDLSSLLEGEFKVGKDGTTTGALDTLYEKHMGTFGITSEQAKAVNHYDSTFIPAVTHAWGNTAIKALAKHPDLQSVAMTVPMNGKNHLELTMHRERTYPVPSVDGAPKRPDVVKHGVVESKYLVAEANASAGQLKQVKIALNVSAAAAYGEKTKA